MITRRSLLTGIIAAAVAPAIIRTPGLLMPIKPKLVSFVQGPSIVRKMVDLFHQAIKSGAAPLDFWASPATAARIDGELGALVNLYSGNVHICGLPVNIRSKLNDTTVYLTSKMTFNAMPELGVEGMSITGFQSDSIVVDEV